MQQPRNSVTVPPIAKARPVKVVHNCVEDFEKSVLKNAA
jgi:hypothetical protein